MTGTTLFGTLIVRLGTYVTDSSATYVRAR